MLGAHALAPGQLFQLAAQVVHSFSHGAEMPAPVDDLRVEPQRGGHHHKAVGQHSQLHRQLVGRNGHQLQKDELHSVGKIGLWAELGTEQIHQHEGHHQIQRQRPPQAPPRHEGCQADQHHLHRDARHLPGAKVLPVAGAEHQRQERGHHHIPHPEDAPDAEQQRKRNQNGGQCRRPSRPNGRQPPAGEFLPESGPPAPAHRIRRRTTRSPFSVKGGNAARMGKSPRRSTLRWWEKVRKPAWPW